MDSSHAGKCVGLYLAGRIAVVGIVAVSGRVVVATSVGALRVFTRYKLSAARAANLARVGGVQSGLVGGRSENKEARRWPGDFTGK